MAARNLGREWYKKDQALRDQLERYEEGLGIFEAALAAAYNATAKVKTQHRGSATVASATVAACREATARIEQAQEQYRAELAAIKKQRVIHKAKEPKES